MSKLKVDYINIDELIPYINNSRTHSDEQVAQIASSIKEFGFTNPVLIDVDGGIIAGHGRVLAARRLKLDQVPVIVLAGLSEAQKKAYIIADNKLALNAGWNDELLALEVEGLIDSGFDTSLLGFTDTEVELITGGWDSDFDESDLPEESERGSDSSEDDGKSLVFINLKVISFDELQAKELIENALDSNGVYYEYR